MKLNKIQHKGVINGILHGIPSSFMSKKLNIHYKWLQRFIKKDIDCQLATNRYEDFCEHLFD